MYTRPHRFYRYFKPKNMIGLLTGYNSCECGNNYRFSCADYSTSPHSGRLICNDCHKAYACEIYWSDHRINCEPVIGMGVGYSHQICSNPFCKWHYEDKRFYWHDERGYWNLTEAETQKGYALYEMSKAKKSRIY